MIEINKEKIIKIVSSLIIIISIMVVSFFIATNTDESDDSFLICFDNGRTGSFFFENNTKINLLYSFFTNDCELLSWSIITESTNQLSFSKNIDTRKNNERGGVSGFSGIRGITTTKGKNYLFANGQNGLFFPKVVGQYTEDFENWFPAPTFLDNTLSDTFSRVIGVQANSSNSVLVCFSDLYDGWGTRSNYTFYILELVEDNWNLETITFSGNLQNLGRAYFYLYQDKPLICWSFYNESTDLIELNLSIRNETSSWLNFTISFPEQDLFVCGFDEKNSNFAMYFYGLNYVPYSLESYTHTTLYSASLLNNNLNVLSLLSLPHAFNLFDRCMYHWDNGSISLFMKEIYNQSNCFLGLYTEGKLTLTKVAYNHSSIITIPFQLGVNSDRVYLLWAETLPSSGPDSPSNRSLYFAMFPRNASFSSIFSKSAYSIKLCFYPSYIFATSCYAMKYQRKDLKIV
jgi:hypothetical protein